MPMAKTDVSDLEITLSLPVDNPKYFEWSFEVYFKDQVAPWLQLNDHITKIWNWERDVDHYEQKHFFFSVVVLYV